MYILVIKTSASDHNFKIGASQLISRTLYLLRPMMTFHSYGSTTTGGAKLVQPQLPWHRLEAEWLPMAPATNTFTHIHNPMWVKCVAPGQRLGEISNHQTSSYWTDPPAALKSRRAPGSQTPQKLLLNSSAQKKKVCRFWLHFFLRWAQTG